MEADGSKCRPVNKDYLKNVGLEGVKASFILRAVYYIYYLFLLFKI